MRCKGGKEGGTIYLLKYGMRMDVAKRKKVNEVDGIRKEGDEKGKGPRWKRECRKGLKI